MFELDCSIYAKIGSRTFRQRFIKGNFDIYGPLLHCGVDAHDMAIRDAVASIDQGHLLNHNVLCLGLSDLDLRFQLRRVRDAREIIAGLDALPDLHRQLLQDARHTGVHVQRFDLISLQLGELFGLIDHGLSGRELRINGLCAKSAAFLDRIAIRQFGLFEFRGLVLQVGNQTVLAS